MPDIIITPSSGIIDFFPVSARVGRIEGSGNTINIVNPSGFVAVSGSGLSVNVSSPNATFHAYSATSGATLLNLEGTNGSLFSVIDNLSGTLMSVNNNAGLPVFEVFSDDRVVAGRFGQNDFIMTSGGNVGIGTGVPSSKFHVVGSVLFSSGLSVSGLITSNSGNFINSLTVNSTGVSISGHTHTSSDISNFNSSVSGVVSGIYAPLSSPALIGTPTAPTASSGTNTTQIASTAFVRTEISNLVASAPTTLDTLNELAAALGNDASFSTTVTTNLGGKANLSGSTFTGSVSGPSGNFTSLKVNSVDVSAVGHTHTSSNITDFNSSVSGLLPTIANSGDNRVLTSTGGSVGVNAESNLTFNGNLLSVTGSGSFSNNVTASGFVRSGGTSSQFLKADGSIDSTAYTTNVGTVTSVAALTLGTTGTDVTSTVVSGTTTPVITLNIPTASASNRGALSSTDWTTFNNKQATLSNPVTGTGASNHIAYWSSSSSIAHDSNQLVWDATNNRLGIGTASPTSTLQVSGLVTANSGQFNVLKTLSNGTFTNVSTVDHGHNSSSVVNTFDSPFSVLDDIVGAIAEGGYPQALATLGGQPLLTDPVTGTGASNHIAYWNSSSSIAHDSNQLVWDATNNRLGIGTASPTHSLHVVGSGVFASGLSIFNNDRSFIDDYNNPVQASLFVSGVSYTNSLFVGGGSTGAYGQFGSISTNGSAIFHSLGVGEANDIPGAAVTMNAAGLIVQNYGGYGPVCQLLPNYGAIIAGNLIVEYNSGYGIDPTVGIGTSTPSEALDVIGNIKTDSNLKINNTSLSESQLINIINGGNLYLWSNFR